MMHTPHVPQVSSEALVRIVDLVVMVQQVLCFLKHIFREPVSDLHDILLNVLVCRPRTHQLQHPLRATEARDQTQVLEQLGAAAIILVVEGPLAPTIGYPGVLLCGKLLQPVDVRLQHLLHPLRHVWQEWERHQPSDSSSGSSPPSSSLARQLLEALLELPECRAVSQILLHLRGTEREIDDSSSIQQDSRGVGGWKVWDERAMG